MSDLTKIYTSLFTHHDRYNIHKIMGAICLSHYLLRIWVLLMNKNMFLNSNSSILIPIFHLSLSLSSSIFHVPYTRFMSRVIIWKELQLHNIIFVSRSSLVMIYFLLYPTTIENLNIHFIGRLLIVIYHHILADKVTQLYSVENKTTTRDIPWDNVPNYIMKFMKFYYAICQLLALNALLIGDGNGLLQSAFIIMFPIQLSTFLMTLVRKSIISNNMWHVLYALSLLTPFLIAVNNNADDKYIKIMISLITIILRIILRYNKYVIMITVTLSFLIYKNFF